MFEGIFYQLVLFALLCFTIILADIPQGTDRLPTFSDDGSNNDLAPEREYFEKLPNYTLSKLHNLLLEQPDSFNKAEITMVRTGRKTDFGFPPKNYYRCGVSCKSGGVSDCNDTVGGTDYCWNGWCWFSAEQCDQIIELRFQKALMDRPPYPYCAGPPPPRDPKYKFPY